MPTYRGSWILPVTAAPIRDGWVTVEDGLIVATGAGAPADALDLGHVCILPSLVNAHTHLELSSLRGSVGRADRFLDWIRALLEARRRQRSPDDSTVSNAVRMAIGEARASGTGLIGDVGNTLVAAAQLQDAAMPARLFYELLGFNVTDPGGCVAAARAEVDAARRAAPDVQISLAAHAPYSVSPGLFTAIREDLDQHPRDVSSVHLGESPEEIELLERGTGGWVDLLRELDVWTDEWQPPGRSPVSYLADTGFLDSRVVAVHGVQFTGDDLARLKALGSTIVSCPRSNRYVGVGDPPLEAFYAMGLDVALGTDSLASVDDLNMFHELAAARQLAPRVPARALLESATVCGAKALGFGAELGSLDAGLRASLIAVQLPARVGDVEEYLLSGIEPASIRWILPTTPNAQQPTPNAV